MENYMKTQKLFLLFILTLFQFCSKPFPDSSLLPLLISTNLLGTNSNTSGLIISEGGTNLNIGGELDFSTIRLKANSVKTITIQNTLSQTTTLTISNSNSQFTLGNVSSEITASASTTMNITYNPSILGSQTSTLSIVTSKGTFTITLKGNSIPDKYLFVTQGTYNGNLSGVTGADTICSNEKTNNYSSLPTGTYKALVVAGATRRACTTANCGGGSAENSNWVFLVSQAYYHPSTNEMVFTTNAKGIIDFPISSQLDTGSKTWWTGLDTDWTDPNENCNNWTNTGFTGYSGKSADSTLNFISTGLGGTSLCTATKNLICIEQ